jgi:hypothetical protein
MLELRFCLTVGVVVMQVVDRDDFLIALVLWGAAVTSARLFFIQW